MKDPRHRSFVPERIATGASFVIHLPCSGTMVHVPGRVYIYLYQRNIILPSGDVIGSWSNVVGHKYIVATTMKTNECTPTARPSKMLKDISVLLNGGFSLGGCEMTDIPGAVYGNQPIFATLR